MSWAVREMIDVPLFVRMISSDVNWTVSSINHSQSPLQLDSMQQESRSNEPCLAYEKLTHL